MVIQLFWWREQDLNLRPSGYEPDELPGCSIPRHGFFCFKWCLGRDLNPHVHRGHGILSPVRLPIPPPRHNHLKRLFFSSVSSLRFSLSLADKKKYTVFTSFRQHFFLFFMKFFFNSSYKNSQTHIFHRFHCFL